MLPSSHPAHPKGQLIHWKECKLWSQETTVNKVSLVFVFPSCVMFAWR